MRVLGRLLWIIFSLVMISAAISFTVSNDEFIALALWPFPQKLTMPAWLSVISAFLIGGILVGGLMWGQMLAIRAKLWKSQSKIRKLQEKTPQKIQYGDEKSLLSPTNKRQ